MEMIERWQNRVLKSLAGRVDGYYLGGGTALARIYFHHRQSLDVDFFTPDFSRKGIFSLIGFLSEETGKDFQLIGQQQKKGRVRVLIFATPLSKTQSIKIDFIEDYIKQLRPPRQMDGIWVFSLEDIYLRKIYAVSGTIESPDLTGRKIIVGGRQEAKDFYDLYFLSHTFMNLSIFVLKYCNPTVQEGLIQWFRSYSRMDIKTGLLELKTKNKIDFKDMERHFKKEIGRLIEKQIGGIL